MTAMSRPSLASAPALVSITASPMDLPRLVMRRALWVALGSLALAFALGLLGSWYDTGQEIEGALTLARVDRQLQQMASLPDAEALDGLRALGSLRHVRLDIAEGPRMLFVTPEPPPPSPVLAAMLALNRRVAPVAPPTAVSWPLARPDGHTWIIRFTATPQSEQREAMANLLALFALLALCCGLMLAVMQVNVRRAFRPLQPMLQAIARIGQQDWRALQALPAMPIRELDAIAAALKHLALSLQQAEDARRLLGHQVLNLQEDERQRLARDLHDEFGQRLTALRVDAAWLQKRLAAQPDVMPVVAGMSEHCERIQHDLRGLLARLHPLGDVAEAAPHERLQRLVTLLEGLVASWAATATTRGHHAPLLSVAPEPATGIDLPRDCVLALYRITQEALTNVARHAAGAQARVSLRIEPGGFLYWSVEDDGEGIADVPSAFGRGNGLAGIKERVWVLGGEFSAGPLRAEAPRGWVLQARIPFTAEGATE